MVRSVLVLVLACTLAVPAARSQPTPSGSSLVDAYRAALAYDPKHRAALQVEQAAQEGIALASGARRPEVTLAGSASYNSLDQRGNDAGRASRYTGSNVGLQLRQPIVNRELESQETQARLRARQAEAMLAASRLELSERVVDAYIELAYASSVVALAREDLDRQARSVEIARRSRTGGEGTITEVLEATSRADVLRAQLAAADAARQNAVDGLRALTGPGWEPPLARLTGRLPAAPVSAAAAHESVLMSHPEVMARQAGVELARENVRAAAAPYRTRLDWSLSVGRSDSDVVNSVNQVNVLRSVGVQVSVPLYNGGRSDSAARQAAYLVGEAEAELDDTVASVRLKLQQNLRGLASSLQRWQALQSAKMSTQQLLVATERSIAGGVRSRADLLLAERQLAQVLREELDAVAEHSRTWWRVTAASATAGEPQLIVLEEALEWR